MRKIHGLSRFRANVAFLPPKSTNVYRCRDADCTSDFCKKRPFRGVPKRQSQICIWKVRRKIRGQMVDTSKIGQIWGKNRKIRRIVHVVSRGMSVDYRLESLPGVPNLVNPSDLAVQSTTLCPNGIFVFITGTRRRRSRCSRLRRNCRAPHGYGN